MPRRATILIVDATVELARVLGEQLEELGFDVRTARDGQAALDAVAQGPADVVLTELRLSGMDGHALLDALQASSPDVPVIVTTAGSTPELAVESVRRGAFHHLPKPFRLHELRVQLERAVVERRARQAPPAATPSPIAALGPLVGSSRALARVKERVLRAAHVDAPVLIRGPSGTGKELVARAVHEASARASKPFIAVNCTALPAALLESELFGHDRGAYTGATAARKGLFVEADGGTLFLDEIGDMPVELQSRLLRVLEERRVRPVGSDKERPVDVRLVSATHQPLEQRVDEGRFRADLLFRLDVLTVELPPLDARRDDIPELVRHFLAGARRAWPGVVLDGFDDGGMAALTARAWPGNVRQLRNAVQRIAVQADRPLGDRALVDEVLEGTPMAPVPPVGPPTTSVAAALATLLQAGMDLRSVQQAYVAHVMEASGGNRSQAARRLGVDPSTLFRWEKKGG